MALILCGAEMGESRRQGFTCRGDMTLVAETFTQPPPYTCVEKLDSLFEKTI